MKVWVRLRCSRCGNAIGRRRPARFVQGIRRAVGILRLRCRRCDGKVLVRLGRGRA